MAFDPPPSPTPSSDEREVLLDDDDEAGGVVVDAPKRLHCFDKMMRARGDHRVFTESFSVASYFGPDRPSDRFAGETLPRSSHADVWGDVLPAADRTPVFVKRWRTTSGPTSPP